MENSVVSDNHSEVEAAVPSSFFGDFVQEANASSLYLTQSSTTTIRTRGSLATPSIRAIPPGTHLAEVGGIDAEGSLLLTHSSVSNNTVVALVPASSGFLAETDGGGLQVRGSAVVRDSRIAHNSISATSETGLALASGGGFANIGAA